MVGSAGKSKTFVDHQPTVPADSSWNSARFCRYLHPDQLAGAGLRAGSSPLTASCAIR